MSPFDSQTQTNARTKLAHQRLAIGLTQQQMWEAVGVSRATYVRLEQGRMDNPPLRLLVNCALSLRCELDDLIEDEWRAWHTRRGYAPTQPPEL